MLNISGFSFLPPAKYIKYCSLKGTYKGPILKIQNGSLAHVKCWKTVIIIQFLCPVYALNFVYL
jgi:hypothetical protein